MKLGWRANQETDTEIGWFILGSIVVADKSGYDTACHWLGSGAAKKLGAGQ